MLGPSPVRIWLIQNRSTQKKYFFPSRKSLFWPISTKWNAHPHDIHRWKSLGRWNRDPPSEAAPPSLPPTCQQDFASQSTQASLSVRPSQLPTFQFSLISMFCLSVCRSQPLSSPKFSLFSLVSMSAQVSQPANLKVPKMLQLKLKRGTLIEAYPSNVKEATKDKGT